MNQWHGYIAVSRITANLNESNWVTLVDELRQIIGVGNLPQYRLAERGNLDTFVFDSATYSNIYIYEARFASGAVSFDKFTNRLAALFEVDPIDVSYATATQTFDILPTVIATYQYGVNNRIRVSLFGCASDSELVGWQESASECRSYIAANSTDWNEDIE